MLSVLLTNFALSAALSVALWRVSVHVKDPSFIDAWWALGIVVLAWATFMQAPTPGPHALAILALATLWGLRLGLYLLRRWRDHGKDRRYAALEAQAAKQGLGFAAFSALWVFGPQMLLQFVVALPAMLGQLTERESLGALAWWGATLASFGVAYESIADWQLVRFKSQPVNVAKVMDRGLWRYSRHPNYFGDMCAWWGMWLIALDAGAGRFSLLGPALLTLLLVGVSGAPTTEPHLRATRSDYEAYKRRTSAFVPLPPRRLA